ncbi:MAG: HD domain-containing protein [Bacteroidota bacterium]
MIPTFEKALPLPAALVEALKKTEQNPRYHAEGNVYNHILLVLKQIEEYLDRFDLTEEERIVLYWTGLLHDIGKATATKWQNGRWKAHGHEIAGIAPAREILLNQPEITSQQRKKILDLVRWHSVPRKWMARQASLEEYILLHTRTDLRLLGIFGWFDMAGRICDRKAENMHLLDTFNQEIVPEVIRQVGSFDTLQKAYQQADYQRKNTLWSAYNWKNVRLLKKLLQAPAPAQPVRSHWFCVVPIGLPNEKLQQYLEQYFPQHPRFQLSGKPYAEADHTARQSMERSMRNFISVYAESSRSILIEGPFWKKELREIMTQAVRHQGGQLHFLYLEQGSETSDDHRNLQKYLQLPHPWEAHKLEIQELR